MDFAYQGRHALAKLASIVANTTQVQASNSWLTNTRCSYHVTPNLSQLSLHQQPIQGNETVTVGNGQELLVTHIGNGKLQTLTYNFRLDNILRVPDLASNLLSVHKLCLQNNVICYFDANKFLIQDLPMGKILYAGLSRDGVYPIPSISDLSSSLNHFKSFAFVSIKPHQILLWHHRLGHPHSRALYSVRKTVFSSLSLSMIDEVCSSCEYCISAKMHRLHLNKSSIVSTSILEVVHSDVWGPSPITSLLGFNYYVLFVDDYTCFTWLFLVKSKSEVLSMFKHFKNMVETQDNSKLKILRIDNGFEYTNAEFQYYCSAHGILHQSSCPHTPEQNGVSERKHRHVVEIGLALLYQSHLPFNFWSYAFTAATYLINRLPSSVLSFSLLGRNCILKHLLFMLLNLLGVLVLLFLDPIIRTSYNLGLPHAFFLAIHHCLKGIFALILHPTKFILLVMFCLMKLSSL